MTEKTALQIALTHLAALPPEKALEHRLLMQLLVLEEAKPLIQAAVVAIGASRSAAEARNQARFEQEQAESVRAAAHQASMDALDLEDRRVDLESKKERLATDKLSREEREELLARDRAARRANGSHS